MSSLPAEKCLFVVEFNFSFEIFSNELTRKEKKRKNSFLPFTDAVRLPPKTYKQYKTLTSQRFNASFELIGDVQFMRIEEENDPIDSLCKPLHDTIEVITAVDSAK